MAVAWLVALGSAAGLTWLRQRLFAAPSRRYRCSLTLPAEMWPLASRRDLLN